MFVVLAVGDIHVKVDNTTDTDTLRSNLVSIIQKTHPDLIVILGDILDRFGTIKTDPLCRAVEIFQDIHECTSAPMYFLIGNHDRVNNQDFLSDRHPFTALKKWPRTTVVDTTVISEFKDDQKNTFKIGFVPYVPPGRFEEALKKGNTEISSLSAIFAHQEFKNAQLGTVKSSGGDVWPSNSPPCFSGHIHDYDQLQSNLLYVGAPFQHNFGEKGGRTVSLLNFEYSSELKAMKWKEERVVLSIPPKLQVTITTEELTTYTPPENAYVKLIIKGDPSNIRSILQMEKCRQLKTNPRIKIEIKDTRTSKANSLLTFAEVSKPKKLALSFQQRMIHAVMTGKTDVKDVFQKYFKSILPSEEPIKIKVKFKKI